MSLFTIRKEQMGASHIADCRSARKCAGRLPWKHPQVAPESRARIYDRLRFGRQCTGPAGVVTAEASRRA